MSHGRDRRPRRPRSDGPQSPDAALKEVEKQVRQIARSFEHLSKSFSRLTEVLADLPRMSFDHHDGGNGRRDNGEEPQRLQAADLPGAPQASTHALEMALTTSVDERAKDFLTEAVELFEDADRGIPELRDFSMRGRSAHLAVWAGRGRALQSSLEPWWDQLPEGVEKSFRVFFGKLTTVTKRLRCEWVDALHRAWSTDWDVYVRFYERRLADEVPDSPNAAEDAELTESEEQTLARDRLAGLMQRSRPRPSDARQLILEASEVLDVVDDMLCRVLDQYAGLLRGHEDFVELLADAGIDAHDDAHDDAQEPVGA